MFISHLLNRRNRCGRDRSPVTSLRCATRGAGRRIRLARGLEHRLGLAQAGGRVAACYSGSTQWLGEMRIFHGQQRSSNCERYHRLRKVLACLLLGAAYFVCGVLACLLHDSFLT